MLDNSVYNLMNQLVEESKSLQRIKEEYKKTNHCDECNQIWEKLEKDKEEHIDELSELLKIHL